MFDNEYDLARDLKKKEVMNSKAKTVGPAFKTSSVVDNATGKNWNLPSDMRDNDY